MCGPSVSDIQVLFILSLTDPKLEDLIEAYAPSIHHHHLKPLDPLEIIVLCEATRYV